MKSIQIILLKSNYFIKSIIYISRQYLGLSYLIAKLKQLNVENKTSYLLNFFLLITEILA